jgi:hypothetical protein
MHSIINDAGTLASIVGLPISLIQWWKAYRSERKANDEGDASKSIQDYLEWLRRQDHQEIISAIEQSSTSLDELRELLARLLANTESEAIVQLEKIVGESEHRLSDCPIR